MQPIIATVPEDAEPIRADKFLTGILGDISRTQVQKLFDDGKVQLRGALLKKSELLYPGDTLEAEWEAPTVAVLEPVKMDLNILHEDKHLVVINKPAGLVVHPGNGTGDTLVQGALQHCKGKLSALGGALRPGIVHRLDKDTTGCIVFAKTDAAYLRLIELFAERQLRKEYLALVMGVPRLLGGSIREPIERHPTIRVKMSVGPGGREAHTDWQLEKPYGKAYSLIRCKLHTGRTHQIRVHLSHLQHPIVGDVTYGYRANMQCRLNAERVMLHAALLEFEHPITEELLTVQAPIPHDMAALMLQLESHFDQPAIPVQRKIPESF